MFCMLKKKNIYPVYVSKCNSNSEKQVIILIILNGEGWNYLAVKKLSALLGRITSKHLCNFYYLNCIHSFQQKTNVSLIINNYVKIKVFVTL